LDIEKHIGQIDRTRFEEAHNGSVYCQPLFELLDLDEIRPDTFAYRPCWGILDPGMTLEAHQHPIPEFFVFISGEGLMRLDEEQFEVRGGMAINIPRGALHEVKAMESAVQPLVWVSIGMKESKPAT
jgi:mannose-6-phosphate isomerase-like protein (cupin superfamily)